ncbi:hypothetical protein EfmAA242_08820 [Enterococcus faecium]|nr:hypothetical protein EfmAA242_08820 [Enterococcus faecium]
MNQSIIVAQDTADKVVFTTKNESEVIVTSAQNKADELIHWEGSIFQITTYMKCLQIRHKEFVRDKKR